MEKEVLVIKTILNGLDESHITDKYIKMFYENSGEDKYKYIIDTYAFDNKQSSSDAVPKNNEIEELHSKLLSGVLNYVGNTVKVRRSVFLTNLSDIIKTFEIARVYENNMADEELKEDSDDDNEKKERFHTKLTQKLIDDIKRDGRVYETKQDEGFARRNFYLSVFQDTESIYKSLIENKNDSPLKKMYAINTNNLMLTKNFSCETIPINKNIKMIKCTFDNTSYPTIVSVVNRDALTEICSTDNKNAVYCMAGNQLIPGGNSDQGIYTHESDVYLATTYGCSIENSSEIYPLDNDTVILSPFVIVIKDHQKQYERIKNFKSIQIMTYTPKYRPNTTLINQLHNELDTRLITDECYYVNPLEVEQQYNNVFKTAMFFNYDTIILDDRGIEAFWLPLRHTAQILSKVIRTHMNRFKQIIVAVKNPYIYEIFRTII